jgi:UDP-N-acetylglucosamine transferase subunit ALG13
MIFVTIGNEQRYKFTRLLRKMDELAPEISEEIVMQIGFDSYQPKHCNYFSFIPHEEYIELFKRSKLVISHCATGPIIYAKKYNKPLILFPRKAEYNEHLDNHQMETAKSVEGRKGIHIAYQEEELKPKIMALLNVEGIEKECQRDQEAQILETIRVFLKVLESTKMDRRLGGNSSWK